jgi:signal transduction histidine kinase
MHPILADRQRLQLHLIAWGLGGLLFGALIRAMTGADWIDAIVFALPLALLAAPISLSAWYVCRATPVSRASPARVAVTALVAALFTASIWASIGRLWWTLLGRGGFGIGQIAAPGLFPVLVGVGALAYLVAITVQYVVQAFEESAAASRKALESQVAQRDAELRALRAQVDPHFLFNSLNSVAGLIGPDPAKARLMCQMLGEFLRDSLRLGSAARIPLAREAALAEQYLRVEQIRFGARLDVTMALDPDAARVAVPPLILQPLVENAVRHGIGTRLDGGTVRVETRRVGTRALITVANPRDPDVVRRGTGFGLEIVRGRLQQMFGDRASLSIDAGSDAYRVLVTLPVEEIDEVEPPRQVAERAAVGGHA